MKKEDLKPRLIKDEQVFDNSQMEQAGLMGSGGCGGCGCGCGGRVNVSEIISLHTSADLNGHNWTITGSANVYAIVSFKTTFGCDIQYSMTVFVTTTIQLDGENSCTINAEGEKSCIGGNTVMATGSISNSTGGTSAYLSGTIGTGRFTASRTEYDKDGKLSSSETVLDKIADIELSLSIKYDESNGTLNINENDVKIALSALIS